MPDPTLTRSRLATEARPVPPPVSPPATREGSKLRKEAMAVITVACLVLAGAYFVVAARRDTAEAGAPVAAPVVDLAGLADQPHLLFLDDDGDTYRRVAAAEPGGVPPSGAGTDDGRLITDLRCQRFYSAAGRGLCVEADQFGGDISILDENLEVVHRIGISGIPSRARVSPDGRFGSTTLFVTGHSYSEGGFSTATVLIDMESGTEIANLEDFTVMRDGRPFDAVDFNFWGVTFAEDSNRFYATLGTGGSTYLLEGDVARREVTVLRDNVECPSLSPDGTRIAFKKRVDGGGLFEPVRWQIHLLDLATMEETPVGDARNVDDQVEWIDDEHLVYAVQDEGPPPTLRPDLWVLPLDGTPQRVAYGASSPVAVGGPELTADG
jgi:hypothetical protein